MRGLRDRLTYANVMATVAVFIALGGTSVAAVQLANNSVGSAQIVNDSVRSGDIRDGSVTHEDVRDGTLRGADIATNTIGTRNLVDNGIHAADLGTNSVTGKAIEDGAVGSDDVADGSLTGADLKDGSVNGKKVADGSITTDDLAPGTLPRLEKPLEDGPADVPTLRSLGTLATQAAAGDDSRLSDARIPKGAAGGDLDGTYPNPTITASLKDGAAGLATLRSLGTGATQAAAGNDARLSNARTPTGTAGGDLDGTYPNPQIGAGTVGTAEESTKPAARVVQTSPQTTADTVIGKARLDSATFANGVTFDNANDELVIQDGGTYAITATTVWAANGSGPRALFVNVTTQNEVSGDVRTAVTGFPTYNSTSTIVRLSTGDRVSLGIGQNSGGDLATDISFTPGVVLTVGWIGP